MKKIVFIGIIASLTACTTKNMNPDNIHLDTTNYITDIQAIDSVKNEKLVVNITGKTYEDTTFWYRVQWFDENGIALDTISAKPAMEKIRRESPFNWVVSAPNIRAKSYQVYISDRPIKQ